VLRKKTFLFFLLGLMVMLCLAVPAWANGPSIGPVTPATVNINQEFDVNVEVNNVINLAAVEFKLSYDPNILEALSVTKGVPAKAMVFKDDITTGLVWFASTITNQADVYTGSDVVAVVKFRAKEEVGSSTLALSNTVLGYWDASGTGAIPHNILPAATVNVVQIVVPTVQTNAATGITTNSATLNGEITNTGGENCDQRKFQYRQQGAGTWIDAGVQTGTFGTGAFSFALTGLTEGTGYEYKAMAHNSANWGEGSVVQFTTNSEPQVLDININLNPAEDISFTRPLTITGTATGPGADNVAWQVEIKDGDVVIASHTPANGPNFTWEYSPVEGLPIVGSYSVRVVATPEAGAPVEKVVPFNIYNYPLKITDLNIVNNGATHTLSGTVTNLENSSQPVVGICQVTGPDGSVVFLEPAAQITVDALGSQTIVFTFNTPQAAGTYKAELFIWLLNDGIRTVGTPKDTTFLI
jgi:hypothetical protein